MGHRYEEEEKFAHYDPELDRQRQKQGVTYGSGPPAYPPAQQSGPSPRSNSPYGLDNASKRPAGRGAPPPPPYVDQGNSEPGYGGAPARPAGRGAPPPPPYVDQGISEPGYGGASARPYGADMSQETGGPGRFREPTYPPYDNGGVQAGYAKPSKPGYVDESDLPGRGAPLGAGRGSARPGYVDQGRLPGRGAQSEGGRGFTRPSYVDEDTIPGRGAPLGSGRDPARPGYANQVDQPRLGAQSDGGFARHIDVDEGGQFSRGAPGGTARSSSTKPGYVDDDEDDEEEGGLPFRGPPLGTRMSGPIGYQDEQVDEHRSSFHGAPAASGRGPMRPGYMDEGGPPSRGALETRGVSGKPGYVDDYADEGRPHSRGPSVETGRGSSRPGYLDEGGMQGRGAPVGTGRGSMKPGYEDDYADEGRPLGRGAAPGAGSGSVRPGYVDEGGLPGRGAPLGTGRGSMKPGYGNDYADEGRPPGRGVPPGAGRGSVRPGYVDEGGVSGRGAPLGTGRGSIHPGYGDDYADGGWLPGRGGPPRMGRGSGRLGYVDEYDTSSHGPPSGRGGGSIPPLGAGRYVYGGLQPEEVPEFDDAHGAAPAPISSEFAHQVYASVFSDPVYGGAVQLNPNAGYMEEPGQLQQHHHKMDVLRHPDQF